MRPSVTDGPRFLAPAAGYTTNAAAAIDRLEAVDEAEQARQTSEAHRRADRAITQEWQELRRDLLATADRLHGLLGPRSAWAVRDLARVADRLDRQIRA